MLIRNIELICNAGEQRLSAEIRFESVKRSRFNLWYSFPTNVSVNNNGDAFLAACLFPAMVLEDRLVIEQSVSPQLLSSAENIQDIFLHWNKNAKRIPIEAPIEVSSSNQGDRVGSYFSMGVDSFYTILTKRPNTEQSIDSLIYIHGFDISLDNEELYQKVKNNLEKVANSLGKTLILVKTNVRSFGDMKLQWGDDYHGAALASVGLALGQVYKKLYIPATCSYNDLYPWGSHPLLDPLWSNEKTTFCHHGAEINRAGKIAKVISKSDLALKHLRVCYLNHNGSYNCGCCEKCIYTMLALYAAGALDACTTFSSQLSLKSVKRLPHSEDTISYSEENIKLLKHMPVSKETKRFIKALTAINRRAKFLELRQQIGQVFKCRFS